MPLRPEKPLLFSIRNFPFDFKMQKSVVLIGWLENTPHVTSHGACVRLVCSVRLKDLTLMSLQSSQCVIFSVRQRQEFPCVWALCLWWHEQTFPRDWGDGDRAWPGVLRQTVPPQPGELHQHRNTPQRQILLKKRLRVYIYAVLWVLKSWLTWRGHVVGIPR